MSIVFNIYPLGATRPEVGVENILSLSFSINLCGGDSFSIGNVAVPELSGSIYMSQEDYIDINGLTGEFKLVYMVDESGTWQDYGYYKAQAGDLEYTDEVLTFTAHGRGEHLLNQYPVEPGLICNQTDIKQYSTGVTYQYQNKIGNPPYVSQPVLTWRQALDIIADACGATVYYDSTGDFNVASYLQGQKIYTQLYEWAQPVTEPGQIPEPIRTPDARPAKYYYACAAAKVGMNVVERRDGSFVIMRMESGTSSVSISPEKVYEGGVHVLGSQCAISKVELISSSTETPNGNSEGKYFANQTYTSGDDTGLKVSCTAEFEGSVFQTDDAQTALWGITHLYEAYGMPSWTPMEVDFEGDDYLDDIWVNKVVTVTVGDTVHTIPVLQYSWEYDGSIRAHISSKNEYDGNSTNVDGSQLSNGLSKSIAATNQLAATTAAESAESTEKIDQVEEMVYTRVYVPDYDHITLRNDASTGGGFIDLAYGNDVFIGLRRNEGGASRLWVSTDGESWAGAGSIAWGITVLSIQYIGTKFFIFASNSVYVTEDGESISQLTCGGSNITDPGDVAYGQNQYLMTHKQSAHWRTSTDGIVWTEQSVNLDAGATLMEPPGIIYHAHTAQWVISVETMSVYASEDGIDWTYKMTRSGMCSWPQGRYILIGANNQIIVNSGQYWMVVDNQLTSFTTYSKDQSMSSDRTYPYNPKTVYLDGRYYLCAGIDRGNGLWPLAWTEDFTTIRAMSASTVGLPDTTGSITGIAYNNGVLALVGARADYYSGGSNINSAGYVISSSVSTTYETVSKVSVLETSVRLIEESLGDVESIIAQVNLNTTNIALLSQSLTALEGEVSALQDEVSQFSSSIELLSETVSGLSEDVDGMVSTVQGLSTRLDTAESNIQTMGTTIDTMQTNIIALSARVGAVEDDMELRGTIHSGTWTPKVYAGSTLVSVTVASATYSEWESTDGHHVIVNGELNGSIPNTTSLYITGVPRVPTKRVIGAMSGTITVDPMFSAPVGGNVATVVSLATNGRITVVNKLGVAMQVATAGGGVGIAFSLSYVV